MISRLRKRQETQNKEQEQYKEAVHTLNKKLTTVTKKLKQESNIQEKAQKDKDSLETELTTLREQIEKAKADAVVDFKASKSFIDACAVYYGDGFDDCLEQVRSVYLNLDLSKVTVDDPLLMTLAGGDTIDEETDDSTHAEQGSKDDGMVLAQLALERPVASLILFTEDPHP